MAKDHYGGMIVFSLGQLLLVVFCGPTHTARVAPEPTQKERGKLRTKERNSMLRLAATRAEERTGSIDCICTESQLKQRLIFS